MKRPAILALLLALSLAVVAAPAFANHHAASIVPAPCTIHDEFLANGSAQGQVAQYFSSVRTEPGGAVTAVLFTGAQFTVLDAVTAGPHCWLEVEYMDAGGTVVATGWSAEGYLGAAWLEPLTDLPAVAGYTQNGNAFIPYYDPAGEACPGAPTPQLVVGESAQVAQHFSSLRAGIHSDNVLYTMTMSDLPSFVAAGPFCSYLAHSPYNWYQIEQPLNATGTGTGTTIVGWATEGTGEGYWLEPTTP